MKKQTKEAKTKRNHSNMKKNNKNGNHQKKNKKTYYKTKNTKKSSQINSKKALKDVDKKVIEEVKKVDNKAKKKSFLVVMVLFLVIVAITGISFAFYNYVVKGDVNSIVVGNIYMHYTSGDTISFLNAEPRNSRDDVHYVEFTVDGLNEYTDNDIWYGIDLVHGNVLSGRTEENRIKDELLRFTLTKSVDGGEEEVIIDDMVCPDLSSFRLYVETIPKGTLNEKSHTYKLYMWITDTIKVGNTVYSDYTTEEWNSLFASIKVKVVGDFVEKERDKVVRVIYNPNGGTIDKSYKYYMAGDRYGTLPVPVRDGYKFLGWELENGTLVNENDVVGVAYQYNGDRVFTGATNDYINTNIYLFDNNNWQENFYMSFEKKEDSSTDNNATLMCSKNEVGEPWPGLDFRHKNSLTTLHSKATKANGVAKDLSNLSNNIRNVKYLRINNMLYYSFDSNTFTPMLDFSGFYLQFDVPVTFGAGLKKAGGAPQRYFKGTLSNMVIAFLDKDATLDNYQEHFKSTWPNVYLKARWAQDKINTFPQFITSNKESIKKIYFKKINDTDLARYNETNSSLKGDIATIGSVKAWLELDNSDNLYTLYVESETPTYLTTGNNLFSGFTNVTDIDLDNIDTSEVVNMQQMFYGNTNLVHLNISNFDTREVENMRLMFCDCMNLVNFDVSHFNTRNVTNMNGMFRGCKSLTSLDLRNFDTSQVTTMVDMFNSCISLTSLNVSSFVTNNVTNMYAMFLGCQFGSLDVSNFVTSNVTNMSLMFSTCSKLTYLNLSSFSTGNVTDMSGMFTGCQRITNIILGSNFVTNNVTNMSIMFKNCSKLTELDLSHFDTSSVTNMNNMFFNCNKLKTIYVSNTWVIGVGVTGDDMFSDCSLLLGKSENELYTYDSTKTGISMATMATDLSEGYLTSITLKPSQ